MANETNPVPARADESGGPDTAGLPLEAVVGPEEVSTEALRKAEVLHRGRGGGDEPPRRRGRAPHHRHRRHHVGVPPLGRLRHRADPGAALHPRRLRAGAELPALPGGGSLSQPHPLVGRAPGGRQRRDHRLRALWRRRLHRPRDRPGALGRDPRRRLHRPAARGDAAHHRPDHAGRLHPLHPLRDARAAPAAALDAPRLRLPAPRRAPVHDARGHLRRRGRRLVDAHHPVHDLRRLPQPVRRRQVLHRLLARAHGRQAQQRRPGGRAVVVPPRRTVGHRASRRR